MTEEDPRQWGHFCNGTPEHLSISVRECPKCGFEDPESFEDRVKEDEVAMEPVVTPLVGD